MEQEKKYMRLGKFKEKIVSVYEERQNILKNCLLLDEKYNSMILELERNRKWNWLLGDNELMQLILDMFHEDTVLVVKNILDEYILQHPAEEKDELALKKRIGRYLHKLKNLGILKTEFLPRVGHRWMTILWLAPFFEKEHYTAKKKEYILIGECTKNHKEKQTEETKQITQEKYMARKCESCGKIRPLSENKCLCSWTGHTIINVLDELNG